MTTKVNTNPLSNKFKPQSKIRVFTIPSTTPVHKCNTKPLRASPGYKIADCELSNSYLLTHKIFSSTFFYNLVNSVEL